KKLFLHRPFCDEPEDQPMDIRIENLTKRFGPQKAVDNISFDVKTGEIVGFLGPNGAGKSTTMKMITGYLGIGEGDIFIGDKSVRQHGDELKRHIGYLPENNPLYTDMPVIDYLIFSAELQGLDKAKIPGRVREMIEVTGLKAEKHKKIGELSKGYRQRVGLAQAMIHDPEILILDEPTTGLDPNQIVEIRKLIRELGQHKTVILSTHILPEVEATCDRILIINKGKIVANGTAESLRSQSSGSAVMRVVIEGGPAELIKSAISKLPGIRQVVITDAQSGKLEVTAEPGTVLGRSLFYMCVEKGWVLTEAVPVETRLEDIFRNLTLN
ncbi:MAG: ATP-binding cassette domain-containing protein, partial [Cyclobacteriaceae bacterium]|nr:ATP-binding cassette domain-containing protein [Cyclobacteriaceae bacterium]